MIIDCDDCALQHTKACEDCVVTFLLDGAEGAVALDLDHARALRNLQEGGLAPRSRFRPTGPVPAVP